MNISITAPFGRAYRQTVGMLFAPFRIGKWMTLGFSAWLARLGQGGCTSNIDIGSSEQVEKEHVGEALDWMRTAFSEHLLLSTSLLTLLAVLVVLFAALIIWITSRGRFMFLDNVMQDRALVAAPWKQFRDLARSLFIWRFFFGLTLCAFSLLILSVPVLIAAPEIVEAINNPASLWNAKIVISLGVALPTLCLLAIVYIYISLFLDHFITPVMYKHEVSTTLAWGIFMPLLRAHFWHFVLYGLFLFLLTIPLGFVVVILTIASCCLFGLLISIPYIGAVISLPVYVFIRFYSVEFLGQFSPDVNLCVSPPELPGRTEAMT